MRNWRCGATVGVLLLGASVLHGQTSAALSGTVTAAGGPTAGVMVTVSSPSLQGQRSTFTNNAGVYHFAALPPGGYRIEFTRDDLLAVHADAKLRLSQLSRVDAVMNPRSVSETIIVMASSPPVLESPQVSTSLTLGEVERLPIQRNQLATSQFAPGVSANAVSNGQLQISGGYGYDNLVLVNGAVVTENTRGQMRPMYVEDAIQETTVMTGAVSAEYGRFSGGVISTITKSGGNELTVSLRDSMTNPRWSAVTPAGETREDRLNHVWEATLGGYVLRDRLWFFAAGRWARNDTARQTLSVPGSGTSLSYLEGNDQKRHELKLTAQLGERHSLTASHFAIDTEGTNVRFNNNIYDRASLTTRRDPESLLTAHGQSVPWSNVLVEAGYSRRRFASRTGATTTDLIDGTLLLDRSNNNTRFHSPSLCGVCGAEDRHNDNWIGAARMLAGRHNLVAGVDRFTESRSANDHQSGSGFSLFVSRVAAQNGALFPVVTPTTPQGGGTFIRWSPILVAAQANELRTESAFVNDLWTLGGRWQFSTGLRWDRNHAADADGVVSSNDRKLAPRLSAQYDLRGDGRQRLGVSYAEYASRIADSIASSNQAAGHAAQIDFAYRGPAINDRQLNTPLPDVIRMVFDYFNATQGGTNNRNAANLRPNGARTIPGFATYFDGTLSSPYVREVTAGYGVRLGRAAHVRADFVMRDWRDFYAASVTTETRRTNTPLGIPVDLTLIRNSNDIERTYRGLQLQGQWSGGALDAGVHYTYATLRGNDEGESGTTGAVANVDPRRFYPEFFAYERAAPAGYLPGDSRHRLRAWTGYSILLGHAALYASLLHNFDSALPYSMAGPINLTRYTGAPANPGYNAIPNGVYYFSGRGALRADDVHSTDLALRLGLRIGPLDCFAQGDVLNVFDNDGIADPQRLGLTVSTAATSPSLQPFNPATETPVLGTHYQLASNFGEPLNDLAYQRPRTWRVSLGIRF